MSSDPWLFIFDIFVPKYSCQNLERGGEGDLPPCIPSSEDPDSLKELKQKDVLVICNLKEKSSLSHRILCTYFIFF